MRVFFFFVMVIFLGIFYLLFKTAQESFVNDPEEQRGVLINLKEKQDDITRTSTAIDQLQDRSNKQQEQITRLESIIAMIQAK